MSDWRIADAAPADCADWAAMRDRLWEEDELAAHSAAVARAVGRADLLALIARTAEGRPAGFAEAALRHDHVNGCDVTPVLFLEGIWVEVDQRRRGLAHRLVEAVAAWGRAHGAAAFASDAALDDNAAIAFHHAVGFAETERVVFFRRAWR